MRRSVARGRVFPQSYSTDRRYGRLSLKAIGLFPLIWANADDQGRLCGDPEEVKYACCPNIDHITKADVPGLLEELERHNLIRVYKTTRSAAIQILDWWDVQKPQWAWPSEYPPLDGWKDSLRYKRGASTVVTENWPPSGERQNGAQVSSNTTPGESQDHSQTSDKIASSGEGKNQAQASHKIPSGKSGNDSQVTPGTISAERPIHAQVSNDTLGESRSNSQASDKIVSGEGNNQAQVELTKERERTKEKEIETEKERRKRNSPESSGEPSGEFSPEKPPPDGGLPSKGLFENLLEKIKGAPNRKDAIARVGELYQICAGRAPPHGRIGVIAKKANYDFGYLAKLIWETTSARPSGDLLSYVEGRMKGERRNNEQQQRESREGQRQSDSGRKDPIQAFRDAGGTVIISGEEAEAGDEDG